MTFTCFDQEQKSCSLSPSLPNTCVLLTRKDSPDFSRFYIATDFLRKSAILKAKLVFSDYPSTFD